MSSRTVTSASKKQAGTPERRAVLKAAVEAMLIYGANLEVFNLTDLKRLGYTEITSWRAIRALLEWGAVRQAAPHAYMISKEAKARFLKEVAVSEARARVVLFEAFGMDGWDEERMDAFLHEFKEHWKRTRRGTEGMATQQHPVASATTFTC